ncbi:cysteine hydrolase family protein [Rhabdaerophilum sp.]|uniref:cysteine hydrolase family protein n=1 Tax=Rhabdaerophilum sp. TaxID=2717341 RepID=UPI0038D3FA6A
MLKLGSRTVLLPVDLQLAFDRAPWPPRNNPASDENGLALLAAWRRKGWPIIHVRHDSVEPGSTLTPGTPGHTFRPGFVPREGEPLVTKSVNSAFIGTDLDLRLKRIGADAVVVFGISTDMCVSTSVRTGANMGWRMILAADACFCFDQKDLDGTVIPADAIHRAHVATLGAEFATAVTTAAILKAVDQPQAA